MSYLAVWIVAVRFIFLAANSYTLGPTSEGMITASFSRSAIRIGVPAPDLALFASRDRLSLSAEIPFNTAKPLRVFIERDFDN